MVVSSLHSCPKSVTICKLREILKQLGYDTKQCICCDVVDNADKKYYKCYRCGYPICESCYDNGGKLNSEDPSELEEKSIKVFCNECYDSYFIPYPY